MCSLDNTSIVIEGKMHLHNFIVNYREDSTIHDGTNEIILTKSSIIRRDND